MILDAKGLKEKLQEKNKKRLDDLKAKNITPKVVTIRQGLDYGAVLYEKSLSKDLLKLGIEHIKLTFDENDDLNFVLDKLEKYLNDKNVGAILPLKPFKNKDVEIAVENKISYEKDIDAVSYYTKGKVYSMEFDGNHPLTPRAAIELLKYNGYKLFKKRCLIINRSTVVGIPLSLMLLKEDATVTICHSKSDDIKGLIRENKFIFTAIGKPNYFDGSYFNSNNVVVDISTNYKDGKVTGDLDYLSCKDVVEALSIVPGGVGILTKELFLSSLLRYYL